MAKPQHRTAEYRAAKAAGAKAVQAGNAYCAQPICIMRNRWIAPGEPWDLAHDDSGTVILGPAHRRCNRRDGAVRGNKMRGKKSHHIAASRDW